MDYFNVETYDVTSCPRHVSKRRFVLTVGIKMYSRRVSTIKQMIKEEKQEQEAGKR
jgi:hypothetical protein